MRGKKDPSARRSALKCEMRKIEPRNLKIKKCFGKPKKLKKQDDKLHLNANDKVPVLVKSENQDQSNSCDSHRILKPFHTVVRFGDISFTSDDPLSKLSEQENAPKTQEIRRSYRKQIRNDIYEFPSQSEEDCDPTADVVKKMVKEGRAKLVKRKSKKPIFNCKPKNKSISECVRSVDRYYRRSCSKIISERKNNCQGTWNQHSEGPKHSQNLNLDEFHESRHNVQNPTENIVSPKNKKIENIKILEVLILPNKATIKPTAPLGDKKLEEAINSKAAVDYSKGIQDMADILGGGVSGSETLLNQDDYLLNEEADYLNLSRISEPSDQIHSCSVDVNSTAIIPDPDLIRLDNKISTQMDSAFADEADLEIHEPKSFVQTDPSVEAKTILKTPEPKPIRKAFWEIEEPEETLDKSLIKKTYSRQKPKEPRTHFFILFSDDENSKKSVKSTKENSSEYYTRSKIQNWIESTKVDTKSENNLDVKQTSKVKKAVLKAQNNISDSHANSRTQQNKINKTIKNNSCSSSTSKARGRSFRQHSLRL